MINLNQPNQKNCENIRIIQPLLGTVYIITYTFFLFTLLNSFSEKGKLEGKGKEREHMDMGESKLENYASILTLDREITKKYNNIIKFKSGFRIISLLPGIYKKYLAMMRGNPL